MKKPNMFIHGEVNDAIDFINECDVMVVPLFSGSGMRVKILEGMALAKVVVSTKLGLEGIDAEDGEEVLIANDPISFVKQIGYCAKYKEELYRIGNSARDFVKTYYDNKQNAEKLLKVYEKLVNEPYPQY
jgi:glycosyltransferase involved in cell wall biosynthesis